VLPVQRTNLSSGPHASALTKQGGSNFLVTRGPESLRAPQASTRRNGHPDLPTARPNFHIGHRCVGCRGGRNTLHHGGRSRAPHRLFFPSNEFCSTKLFSDTAGAACGNRRHFRHYLVGATLILRTDHYSLKWLRTFKRPMGILARWIETLAEFDYTVEHRPDRFHSNADGLSRPFCKQCNDRPNRICGSISYRGQILQSAHGRSTFLILPRK